MTLSQTPVRAASSWVEPRLEDHPFYICPDCHKPLQIAEGALACSGCQIEYPVRDNIVDFVRAGQSPKLPIFTRMILPLLDMVAGIYESSLWYNQVLRLVGGPGAPDFRGLTEIMQDRMDFPEQGSILDAACGPVTWGRRIAGSGRCIHGVDLALPMLRKGLDYVHAGHIPNVRLARGRVERLPFRDATFDGAICGGALHLFPDTVAALREIGRTMRDGARLVGTTFTYGTQGVLALRWLRSNRGLRIFELGELADELAQAGFKHFDPVVHGSVLVFTAERKSR